MTDNEWDVLLGIMGRLEEKSMSTDKRTLLVLVGDERNVLIKSIKTMHDVELAKRQEETRIHNERILELEKMRVQGKL